MLRLSPNFTRLLPLALTLLITLYMVLIGGTFDASVRFRVQALNAGAATLLAVIWLANKITTKHTIRTTGLELPLALLAVSQWIAAAFSLQPRISLEAAASFTTWALIFICVADVLLNGWNRTLLIDALLLVATIITLEGLVETGVWFLSWARIGQLPPVSFRLMGMLGHANLTAAVLNLLLPLVLVRLFTTSRFTRLAYSLLALSILVVIFFTSSRAGWLALAPALAIFFALVWWRDRARWQPLFDRWRSATLPLRAALIGIALLIAVPLGYLLYRQADHITHGDLLNSRQSIWVSAWSAFLERPLTGIGPELYVWNVARYHSVPSYELLPHAHSILMQLVQGSGVLGLAAFLFLLVWTARRLHLQSLEAIALFSGLVAAGIHHLFDYFFTSGVYVFLIVLVAALLFTVKEKSSAPRGLSPYPLTVLVVGLLGFSVFALRGAYFNANGVERAAADDWRGATEQFTQAAANDSAFALYWENLGNAYAHLNEIESAHIAYQKAAELDPAWALYPATLGALTVNAADLEHATQLASGSALYWLNLGVVYEQQAAETAAQTAYQTALQLDPSSAQALFWQQTALRQKVLQDWQAEQPQTETGWTALAANDLDRAITLFEQARAADPENKDPYLGLVRVYWAKGDNAKAQQLLDVAVRLPAYRVWQTLDTIWLRGEAAEKQGDVAKARQYYLQVFSAYNEQTYQGPGSYGYAWRPWVLYHRESLPADIVPQLMTAYFTAIYDARLAQLAAIDETATACVILNRIAREAPHSASGTQATQLCAP